jgi:hypothetical protein
VFCEFPDGSVGGFPSWMVDSRRAVDFTRGASMASASALAELWLLLQDLHSAPDRATAALREVRSSEPNSVE